MKELASETAIAAASQLAKSLEDEMRRLADVGPGEGEFSHNLPDAVTVSLTPDGLRVELDGHCVLSLHKGEVMKYCPGDWEGALKSLRSRLLVAREDHTGFGSAVCRLSKLERELTTVRKWCYASDVPRVERLCRELHHLLRAWDASNNESDCKAPTWPRYWAAYNGDYRRWRVRAEQCLHEIEVVLEEYSRNWGNTGGR